jgi:hypothetical protein
VEQHHLKKTVFEKRISTLKEQLCLKKDSHPRISYVNKPDSTSQLVFASFILLVLLFMSILQIHANSHRENVLSTNKDAFSLIELAYFDQCIAFGSSNSSQLFGLNDIISLGLLSEQDEQHLQTFEKNHRKQNQTSFVAYQYLLYFGVKDQKDVIVIMLLQDSKERFVYESNLDYRFQSIVDELETITNTIFSANFLNNSFQEDEITYSGISISMEQHTQTHQHYLIYRTVIHDIEYGIRKG